MYDYAELDELDHVVGVVSSDEPVTDDPRHLVLLQEGWAWPPAPPFEAYAVLVDGAIAWADARTLQQAQEQARARIQAARELAIQAAGTTAVGTFQVDQASQLNLTSVALLLVVNPQLATVRYTLADNTRPTFTRADFLAAASAIGQAVQACFDTAETLLQQVAAATTNAAADAVQWPTP